MAPTHTHGNASTASAIGYQTGPSSCVSPATTPNALSTTAYGVPGGRSSDPAAEVDRALSELARVVAPGGKLLVTVPYGRAEDHHWFRQFGRDDVERVLGHERWRASGATEYRYSRQGWQLSDLDEASDETYWDHHVDPVVPDDRAAAARAVACLLLET